jgi:hypothetical protein
MNKEEHDEICRQLTDKGKLIEAGFAVLHYTSIPDGVSPYQVADMRYAFFAGAQHLFASLMSILEPGTEATEADVSRITIIQIELEEWVTRMKAARGKVK